MKTTSTTHNETTVAATVAGEDIACGDFVALLNVVYEFPSFLCDGASASLQPGDLIRVRMIPANAGVPYRVMAICLPFVYAEDVAGAPQVMDLRREQIVRLNRQCGKSLWKTLKRAKSERLSCSRRV